MIQIVLDGIYNILKMSSPEDTEKVCNIIEECGGLDKIESLQNHENIEIYRIAFEIIEHYFSDDVSRFLYLNINFSNKTFSNFLIHCGMQVDEDPDLVPETTDNTFQFDAGNSAMPEAGGFNF